MSTERIQKILANAGFGSRRQIETFIEEGRITVNHQVASLGDRISYTDKVCIDGREINLNKSKSQRTRVLLYHKPDGEMCTRHDPEGRPTIFESLPLIRNSRWISIGRLDFNTSGILLITNNGELSHRLMHPSADIEREYAVRIRGKLSDETFKKLQKGLHLKDGFARFQSINDGGGTDTNHWYHVIVKEGRNRLVRRLFEALDLTVSRLIRIRFGNLELPSWLNRGKFKELSEEEVQQLLATYKLLKKNKS